MNKFNINQTGDLAIIRNAISIFEADEETQEPETPTEEAPAPTNVEIAPPPEDTIKNSDFFANNKIRNSIIDNDPAVTNLIKIMSADMLDEEAVKPYIDVFFTKLGLNDIDPEKFKMLSADIWDRLDSMSNMDNRTSLADFITWTKLKIDEYNK